MLFLVFLPVLCVVFWAAWQVASCGDLNSAVHYIGAALLPGLVFDILIYPGIIYLYYGDPDLSKKLKKLKAAIESKSATLELRR